VALWAKIASIDVSLLKPGTAYAAVDAHRLDDFAPHVFRTNDDGKTWRDISAGLPRDHFVNVVRADPKRAGLLYAGTDAGVFVSFDDGAHWTPLGRDLPTAIVNDLLAHDDDLIAATQGRAIWALDDVSSLRQIPSQSDFAHLFAPAIAWRVHSNNGNDTPLPPETPIGQNPPAGAIIDYWLGAAAHGPVTLEIRDAGGRVVRRFVSDTKQPKPKADRYFAAGWIAPPQQLESGAGFHRFVYSIAAIWGRGTPVVPEGPYVLPGKYKIVLGVNGRTYSAPLEVREDPRVKISLADLGSSYALSQRIAAALGRTQKNYGEQESVLDQLGKLSLDSRTRPLADRIREKPAEGTPTFESVDGLLTSVEDDLEAADIAPTAAQRAVVADAQTKLADAERRWNALKTRPLAALNAALAREHRKPVTIPPANALDVEAPDTGQDLP
jgi:hypothetical protein